ncbi:MAG: hypothetical protein PHU12_03400, partial [Candidatus Aenigmarchaeota archaeon]|nr:hypothetical protein [Candidatus Aenigmarchaeota archaeon]
GIRIENRVYQEGPFSKVTLFQLWPVYSKKPEKLKDFFRDTREIIHIIPDSFITPGKVGHLAVRRLGGYHRDCDGEIGPGSSDSRSSDNTRDLTLYGEDRKDLIKMLKKAMTITNMHKEDHVDYEKRNHSSYAYCIKIDSEQAEEFAEMAAKRL